MSQPKDLQPNLNDGIPDRLTDYFSIVPSISDDDTSLNNVEPDDTFTTPLPPMRHWDLKCREDITFVINHRTFRYGYLPTRCLRVMTPHELNEWGYYNEPVSESSRVRYSSVSSYGSSPAHSECPDERGLDLGPIDDRRDLHLPEPESLTYKEEEGGFGWRSDDWAAVNAMRNSSGRRRGFR